MLCREFLFILAYQLLELCRKYKKLSIQEQSLQH
ncbi:Uncharacterised protein [Legionella pneumophila subsp. pascullei]|uniref:Uncharacterized protein n=1 Tax=Legionella pneumophila subsp. pascullei TaxID=91890 RepID=A0AAX2IYE0_LEGPN|nr:Uncharacterised protein [Legionella pneumophila subsp. pascullei]VEH07438.1 Uncharacterised protein [Legionella pneumophila subsp. pascullei]